MSSDLFTKATDDEVTRHRAVPRDTQVEGHCVVSASALDYAVVKRIAEAQDRTHSAVVTDCVQAYLRQLSA